MLRPLRNSIIFTFIDDAAGGKFIPRTASGILMTNQDMSTQAGPRWGKVVSIGPDVNADEIKVDDFILIESLQWTTAFKLDDAGDKMWKTDENKIIAVTNDPVETLML
jgi:hypothetical protein